jgi:hypothetical protein
VAFTFPSALNSARPLPATPTTPGGDDAFDAWMGRVDARLLRKLTLSSRDLPGDRPWRKWFDQGVSVIDAVDMALAEAGL